MKRYTQTGFISNGLPELFFISSCILFVSVLILGNWLARTIAIIILISFSGLLYWVEWSVRFHCGEQVVVTAGMYTGRIGTVQEPLFQGHGARVALSDKSTDSQKIQEIVIFHAHEIKKIRNS